MTIDLDALEALERKATIGEWTSQGFVVVALTADIGVCMAAYSDKSSEEARANAALIAAARNALPELIRLARIGQKVEEGK